MTFPRRIVIAGHSVRAAAEAAQRDGLDVVALDRFGDADTLAASVAWHVYPPGDTPPAGLDLALPWVLSSGFESDAARAVLANVPCLGSAPSVLARVRDPGRFFSALHRLSIAYPAVSLLPMSGPDWLCKDFGACGGSAVQTANRGPRTPASQRYWQQRIDGGQALSIAMIANGQRAVVLGANLSNVQPVDGLQAPGRTEAQNRRQHGPWLFRQLIGPVPWSAVPLTRAQPRLAALANQLTAEFHLRGLMSVDLLLRGDACWVLEVDPRLGANLPLYGAQGGLMQAHLDACEHGHLPDADLTQHLRGPSVRGIAIVRATEDGALTAQHVQALRAQATNGDAHDLPATAQGVRAGDPLCSVQASGPDIDTVRRQLIAREAGCRRLLAAQEASSVPSLSATHPNDDCASARQPPPPPGAGGNQDPTVKPTLTSTATPS